MIRIWRQKPDSSRGWEVTSTSPDLSSASNCSVIAGAWVMNFSPPRRLPEIRPPSSIVTASTFPCSTFWMKAL